MAGDAKSIAIQSRLFDNGCCCFACRKGSWERGSISLAAGYSSEITTILAVRFARRGSFISHSAVQYKTSKVRGDSNEQSRRLVANTEGSCDYFGCRVRPAGARQFRIVSQVRSHGKSSGAARSTTARRSESPVTSSAARRQDVSGLRSFYVVRNSFRTMDLESLRHYSSARASRLSSSMMTSSSASGSASPAGLFASASISERSI